ncbi:MAG: T9SS type A sorting domain-containing protein [Flavobacteriales bacterium]|nr:T9SS type A sorting domain-containing protein [Flavobacteriales bacterium]
MRHSTLLLLTGLSLSAMGQGTITNVQITPNPITECTFMNVTVIGTIPGNAQVTGFTPGQTGNTITIVMNASGTGGGTGSFNQPLPPLGPYPAGVYTIQVSLELNGNIVDTESLQRTVQPGVNPDAGIDASVFGVCDTDPNFLLINELGGSPDPGGVWTNPLNQPHNGNFNPGTDPGGFYLYTIEALAPCSTVQSSVYVEYAPNSDPGDDGAVTVCVSGAPVDLFANLQGTPQTGGTWSGPSPVVNGQYNPATMTPGAYVYTVPGIGNCGDPSATVTVTEANLPNAGTAVPIIACATDTSMTLSIGLTGNPLQTGVWLDPQGFPLGPYNVVINPSIYGAGSFTFRYVAINTFCPNDTTSVPVTLQPAPCDISVQENGAGVTRFTVMPNPARDRATIEVAFTAGLGAVHLELLGTDGRLARRARLAGSGRTDLRHELDLTGLDAGAYLLRLTTDRGSVSRTLVVE